MNTLNIITVIAILLFARLGVRLYKRYKNLKNEKGTHEDSNF